MTRMGRAFTLDVDNLAKIDRLSSLPLDSLEMQKMMEFMPKKRRPEPLQTELLDDKHLSKTDYETLYALIPPEPVAYLDTKKTKPLVRKTDERLPEWKRFLDVAFRQPNYTALLTEARRKQAFNKRIQKRVAAANLYEPVTPVNTSRIVDVLIGLGLAVLEERVASLGTKGSTREDAGQGQNKLSNAGRRKAAQVSTVSRGA